MTNLVDHLRQLALNWLFNVPSFQNAWNQRWRQEIINRVGNNPDVNNILDLGNVLSDVFLTTRAGGRGQGRLTGAGAAWECLVCWYMNLCLLGSRSVSMKYTKTLVPKSITDATTVMYGNFSSASESDIVTIVFPNIDEVTDDLHRENLEASDFKDELDRITETHLNNIQVGITQCKTNWNDNAQTPMLWDMIYRVQQFRDQNISVGTNGFGIQDLGEFTYSFATVPSQNITYSANGTPANRVRNLSGGNFWGHPTQENVAMSIREIFNRNFAAGQNNGLRQDLGNELENLRDDYPYFNL